jgi:AcrR family transcriptional regulator
MTTRSRRGTPRKRSAPPEHPSLKRPGPVGGLRDTNRLQKTQAIREAALTLFLDLGIERVSVDDIMTAANMAKGSFYRYFNDQAQLVEELVRPLKTQMVEVLDSCLTEIEQAFTRLEQNRAYSNVGRVLAGLLIEYPGQVRLYLQESRAPSVGARVPIIELSRLVTRYAIDITTSALQQGLIKNVHPSVSALTVVGTTERLLYAVLLGEDIGPVAKVADDVTRMILDGLKAT